MAERVKELEEDIQEMQRLLLDAERPNVQKVLAQIISKNKTQLDHLKSIKVSQMPKPQPQTTPVKIEQSKETNKINYQPLNKYAWDQQGIKIKLIFSLDGVGKQCTKEQVDVTFDKNAVEMKLRGYNGQNYIFGIKKLFGDINQAQSKYLLKNNSIFIILIKKENKHWDQVAYKQNKFDMDAQKEAKDPQAGLMNMMKKMYDDGDDNMKRSIAQAWTKANDKKGGKQKPDFSDRMDFLNK